MKVEITAENIKSESYYNLVQLCRLTGYANPIRAMLSLKTAWKVQKDKHGNIIGKAS